jgi:hypothetical protein
MSVIVLVVGDTRPDITFRCVEDGAAMDLTGYVSATLKVSKPNGSILTKVLSIVTPETSGVVVGTWTLGDLDQAGRQFGELILVDAAGGIQRSKNPIEFYVRQPYTEVVS